MADVALQTAGGIFFQVSTLTDLIIASRESCIYLGPIVALGDCAELALVVNLGGITTLGELIDSCF